MTSFSLSINRLILKDKEGLNSSVISLVKCKICESVLTDPYDCLCCNNTFCFTCINNYIIRHKKCPYESNFIFSEGEEFNAFNMLKPSNMNLTNFLSSLKFSCCNKALGCSEEIGYNNIIIHEMGCPFTSVNNTIQMTNPPSQNESFNINRKLSIMSFNMKGGESSEMPIHHGGEMQTTNEKIDKIFEYLQYIQFTLNTRNIFTTPTKEITSETPKFNLSMNHNTGKLESTNIHNFNFNSNISNINGSDNHYHGNAYNLTLNLQQEKIISEIELINEKISSIETLIENTMSKNESFVKKLIEEQFNVLFEKMRDCNNSSTQYTSTTNSIANSLFGGFKTTTTSKIESSTGLKRIRIDKNKMKVKEKGNLTGGMFSTPYKANSNTNSPRLINKTLFNEKELKPNKRDSVKVHIDSEKKINSPQDHSLINDGISDKLDYLEKSLAESLFNMGESLKKSINTNIMDEIKTYFLEVTLDSTNLFIQKFDELSNALQHKESIR